MCAYEMFQKVMLINENKINIYAPNAALKFIDRTVKVREEYMYIGAILS